MELWDQSRLRAKARRPRFPDPLVLVIKVYYVLVVLALLL